MRTFVKAHHVGDLLPKIHCQNKSEKFGTNDALLELFVVVIVPAKLSMLIFDVGCVCH